MPTPVDLVVSHIGELATLRGSNGPRVGAAFAELGLIHDGAVACADGKVVAVGKTDEVLRQVAIGPNTTHIEARGQLVTPGLVDAHTHLGFAGHRADEFVSRATGRRDVTQAAETDKGINRTVRMTRETPFDALVAIAKARAKRMLACGTTTIEAKSGYGLDLATELKILKVNWAVAESLPIEVVSTFLGAHAIPEGADAAGYTREVVETMIPAVAAEKIARFCDVFCEEGFFDVAQSEAILRQGQKFGLAAKMHADEFKDTGGAALAARVGAASADHLLFANDDGLQAMAKAGTVAVLLPGTSFFLNIGKYANAPRMAELGVPIALGTDCNPGSCYTESLPMVMTLACLHLKMLPAEALVAATMNAAVASGVADRVGSLEVGKQADLVVWDAPDHRHLAYHYGVNLVERVIKRGTAL